MSEEPSNLPATQQPKERSAEHQAFLDNANQSAERSGAERVFSVKFSTFGGSGNTGANDLGLRGRGQIVISGSTVIMRGHEVTSFGFPLELQYRIDQFADVSVDGNSVRFSLKTESQDLKELRVWTDDVDTAILIAAELPRKVSEEVAAVEKYESQLDGVGRNGAVSISLIVANIGIFVCVVLSGGGLVTPDISVLQVWGTLSGPLVYGGQWWRLLSATFLHFGLIHLTMNMLTLAFVGPFAERELGSTRFAAIYVLSGFGGALCSLVVHPDINGAGASGAIFGIYGALLAIAFRRDLGIPPLVLRRQKALAVAFIVSNIYFALRVHARVDFAAHLGGLIAGAFLGALLATRAPVALTNGGGRRRLGYPEVAVISTICGGALLMVVSHLR